MTEKNRSTETTDREFVITRIFDVPHELVWKAWTKRERLMQWFGPKGFTDARRHAGFPPRRRLSLLLALP